MPTECSASASTPGSAPKPTAATKIMPMMISGTERRQLSTMRQRLIDQRDAAWYCGAASSASGKENTTASAVPAIDIASVSSSGLSQCLPAREIGRHHLRSKLAERRPALHQPLRIEKAGDPQRGDADETMTGRPARHAGNAARRSSARMAS